MKITGLDLVISDACSCLTVLGSSSAVQGKGEAKAPKEEEGVGRKHGQGLGGLCSAGRGARGAAREWSSLQKTPPANSPRVSALILGRTRFSVTAPALLVVPLFMCRWRGHKAGTGMAPRAGRSAAGHRSVDAEGSCPLSGSGGGVGSPR